MSLFDNKELQDVYQKNQRFLKSNEKTLNEISNDIKQLENFLKNNVFKEYSMSLFLDLGEAKEERVRLYWNKTRLMFSGWLQERPLIETKIQIRLQISPLLPQFMERAIHNSILEMGE